MSRQVLDELIKRAVCDAAFRAKLLDPASVAAAIKDYDLTPEEVEKLRRVGVERSATAFPYAEGLSERLAK